jgi:hypothetical protein
MIKLELTINDNGHMEMNWKGVPDPFEAIRILQFAQVNLLNAIQNQITEKRIITPGFIPPGKN